MLLYRLLSENKCEFTYLDGFFSAYSIAQIGKEFDLLRFGNNFNLNIEIKSELKKSLEENKKKILEQLRKNNYYLRFLNHPNKLFAFVEKDGFYEYNPSIDDIGKVNIETVIESIKAQQIDKYADPDKLFVPSNYLISPFNSTEKFIDGEYFLTSAQQKIKEEIFTEITTNRLFFCISANAGTGKTLLLYDIAKTMIQNGKRILLIHCANLNPGQEFLKERYNWNIKCVKLIPHNDDCLNVNDIDVILVDESQRIRSPQLDSLIRKCIKSSTPIIFSYDVKQYLRDGENTDIANYLNKNYPAESVFKKTLTTKIRTNKEMASFIGNLLEIGHCTDHLNYSCISVEYIPCKEDLNMYINHLQKDGWVSITYTTSSKEIDPYDELECLSDKNAHKVIGQEFSKVVFVMDENFKYSENKLLARHSYYSAKGMLYQIVTRAIDELKIIVCNNPDLFHNILKIKYLNKTDIPEST